MSPWLQLFQTAWLARWQVLVCAQNHLSSLFGPYHLFSNQVSSYESCWYVFTLIGPATVIMTESSNLNTTTLQS
eukprot:3814537-Amphidinium_carterae.1